MNMYTNGFSVAMNEEKNEVILGFSQNYPNMNLRSHDRSTNGPQEFTDISSEYVANLVMNIDCAKGLLDTLTRLFEDDNI